MSSETALFFCYQKNGAQGAMFEDEYSVLVTCAFVDGKGRLITDLARGDFRDWEDGVAQTASSFFHQDWLSLAKVVQHVAAVHVCCDDFRIATQRFNRVLSGLLG
jgi:hypothetical protein